MATFTCCTKPSKPRKGGSLGLCACTLYYQSMYNNHGTSVSSKPRKGGLGLWRIFPLTSSVRRIWRICCGTGRRAVSTGPIRDMVIALPPTQTRTPSMISWANNIGQRLIRSHSLEIGGQIVGTWNSSYNQEQDAGTARTLGNGWVLPEVETETDLHVPWDETSVTALLDSQRARIPHPISALASWIHNMYVENEAEIDRIHGTREPLDQQGSRSGTESRRNARTIKQRQHQPDQPAKRRNNTHRNVGRQGHQGRQTCRTAVIPRWSFVLRQRPIVNIKMRIWYLLITFQA